MRRRSLVVPSLSAAVLASAAPAPAQTTSTTPTATTASLTATGNNPFPERFLHYGQPGQQDLGQSTRPAGLNPNGINYTDCISDMTLVYTVYASGFHGQDDVSVWVSTTADCTSDVARGNGGVATCWRVNNGLTALNTTGAKQFSVRVQDLVGPQQAPPATGVLVNEGSSACQSQSGYAGVSFTVYILPLTAGANQYDTSAQGFKQTISVDMVGPPAPVGFNLGAGDTLLTAGWTPNTDPDTAGYDIFIDPPPGQGPNPSVQTICPDAASSSASSANAGSSSGAAADAATDGADAAGADATNGDAGGANAADAAGAGGATPSASSAGCYTINVGATGGGVGSCTSAVLGESMVQDSGAATITTTATTDDSGASSAATTSDSGTMSSSGSSTTNGVGGLSFIPCDYALGINCTAGQPAYTATNTTIFGETNGTYTIRGLTNNVNYSVSIAAVDSSGNVGPAASPQCNYPAPVSDFWSMYRDAGGQAGGGFCGIGAGRKLDESTGAPVGAAIALSSGFAAMLAFGRRRGRRSK